MNIEDLCRGEDLPVAYFIREAARLRVENALLRRELPKEIWFANGLSHAFLSKEEAEKMLREVFPDEDPEKRYARLYYRELYHG